MTSVLHAARDDTTVCARLVFRHCERSEAIQKHGTERVAGRRFCGEGAKIVRPETQIRRPVTVQKADY